MVNKNSGKTVSIFSIIYGIINFASNFQDDDVFGGGVNILGLVLSVALVVVGIVAYSKINSDKNAKGLVITMLVFWFLLIMISISFLIIPILGPIMFILGIGLSIAPVITGFKYLSSLKESNTNYQNNNSNLEFMNDSNDDLSTRLQKVQDLYDKGYISKEEYNETRKKILDENL